ncbi:hypothetical protein [Myxococcus fulvus]|uniref:hypothetical protein n=1 Tax=Myxococcus fulvus TaxID=33 RepID=UPI0020C09619|nr:hypothetical protein [Myxococcus fulvus]MCK8501350.1 hypothetical protein [Myxococcus fulvus]
MALFTPHVDRQLVHLANDGTLPPRQWSRVLNHARGCERCGARYAQVMNLRRVFSRDTVTEPTPGELERLSTHGLQAVLGALERREVSASVDVTKGPWARVLEWVRRAWDLPTLGRVGTAWALALMVSAGVLWTGVREDTGEWAARGEGPGTAVLRLFCVPSDAELREVRGQGTCPSGASLAFAAGVRAPYTHVAVVVRTQQGSRVEGPFEVKAAPGAEAALDITPRLPASGEVELTAIFASSASVALSAARGETVQGEVVQVRHRVRVGGGKP